MDQVTKISGLKIKRIEKITDDRGQLLHFLKKDSAEFKQFGEVYFSLTYQNIIKGWKKHLQMTQNFVCPFGEIQLVIYDERENSTSHGQVEVLKFGLDNYQLITIPPGLWYSFRAISSPHAIICNLTDIPHTPNESVTLPLDSPTIPYRW